MVNDKFHQLMNGVTYKKCTQSLIKIHIRNSVLYKHGLTDRDKEHANYKFQATISPILICIIAKIDKRTRSSKYTSDVQIVPTTDGLKAKLEIFRKSNNNDIETKMQRYIKHTNERAKK